MKGMKVFGITGLILGCLLITGCRSGGSGGLFHRNEPQQPKPPAPTCPPGTMPVCAPVAQMGMAAPVCPPPPCYTPCP